MKSISKSEQEINVFHRPIFSPLLVVLFLWPGFILAQIVFAPVQTSTESSLRGLYAISESICWVSGSEGTVLRTTDEGKTWENLSPEGYEGLQFRDIHAFGKDTAIILSAGLPAVICKTVNGGKSWKEVYRNEAEGVFFDAMDFWDKQRGMAFSDAPEEHLLIITTIDAGETWKEIPKKYSPKVFPHQGGFAASGTCINTFGESSALIGLGGPEATILFTNDFGKTWIKTRAPIDFGEPSKGIFSIYMLNENYGFCVGGDYQADSLTNQNMATTKDGGKTWQALEHPEILSLYKSCVNVINENDIIATSRTGIIYSHDNGKTWHKLNGSFYSVSTVNGVSWLSGPSGYVARITW
ncbi:WD40/YVTN/BNR-like repeat-containing protein [Owenweeksia hongkongensis]|uniref:WD40/YVTN/BNR-like repeat-containing protein n=1 Tax=Owenweeksia hongkongensis TaxID=253245 RepID=UPI003A90CB0D